MRSHAQHLDYKPAALFKKYFSSFIHLSFSDRPRVSTSHNKFTFKEGDPATITTAIDANPAANKFAWLKSGETVETTTDLSFSSIHRQDAGGYTFSATNDPTSVGSTTLTGSVDIAIVVNC